MQLLNVIVPIMKLWSELSLLIKEAFIMSDDTIVALVTMLPTLGAWLQVI